jgi:hypothetical protein
MRLGRKPPARERVSASTRGQDYQRNRSHWRGPPTRQGAKARVRAPTSCGIKASRACASRCANVKLAELLGTSGTVSIRRAMSPFGGTATRGWAVSWSYVGPPLLGASSRRSNVWLRRFRETSLFAGILRTAVSERCVLSLFKVFTFAPRDDVVVRFERLHRRVVRAASSLPRRSADDEPGSAIRSTPQADVPRLAIPLVEALPAFAQRAPVPESRQGR